MLRKTFYNPAGIVGIILLVLGLLLGSNYDPKPYEQQSTYEITDPFQAAQVMTQNTQKAQERQTELSIIWGCIGFGLLMLGSAAWKDIRTVPNTEKVSTEEKSDRTQ